MKTLSVIALMLAGWNMLPAQQKILKEGHRGCRGLLPENTIPSMKKALDLGADVLELDVVISKDKQVVVSHDLYMESDFSLKPNGDTITAEEEKQIILYAMPYAEIRKFDVGTRHNAKFPEQQNFRAHKPLLAELIDAVDSYAKEKGMPPPNYNIEIKSDPKTDNTHQPEPQAFVDLVMKVCTGKNIVNRMNIQSFDVRPLQLIHQQYPAVRLAYLTSNEKTIEENFSDLGFVPPLYSPYYKTVNSEAVKYCHDKAVKIIPWTVNTREEIDALISMGVDGIITDYPNLF